MVMAGFGASALWSCMHGRLVVCTHGLGLHCGRVHACAVAGRSSVVADALLHGWDMEKPRRQRQSDAATCASSDRRGLHVAWRVLACTLHVLQCCACKHHVRRWQLHAAQTRAIRQVLRNVARWARLQGNDM